MILLSLDTSTNIAFFIFIFGGSILLRSLLGLYYSGRQSERSFLFSHSTHSLHISAPVGHLQVNIIISCEASYAF
jgi:hypothetical protein